MKKNFKWYSRYALVTGAASGMGRIYSQELALKGYNVILVDINASGLEETASIVRQTVESAAKVPSEVKSLLNVMPVVQDLSVMDAADRIFEVTEANGCEVEVLNTPEDYFPTPFAWGNHSGSAFRLKFKGKTFMVLGDCE